MCEKQNNTCCYVTLGVIGFFIAFCVYMMNKGSGVSPDDSMEQEAMFMMKDTLDNYYAMK